MNLFTSALAQTTPALTPAVAPASGFDWTLLGGGGAAIVVAGLLWYFLVYKKGKASVVGTAVGGVVGTIGSAVGSSVMADLTSALNKAQTAIASHAQTIQQQASIIASPPVQAAINAAQPSGNGIPVLNNYSAAALLAARSYRVASFVFGANDPKTLAFIQQLSAYPHWSDVLTYVSTSGLDTAAESTLYQQFNAQKQAT